jgi:thioredoxin 1
MKAILFFAVLFSIILTSCASGTEEQKNLETAAIDNKKETENKSETDLPKEEAEPKVENPKQVNNATPVDVNDADFDKIVLKSDKVVVVDFWATWCRPCLAIAPYMKELASEYSEKVVVAKLDVDKNPNTAAKYEARSIPLVLIFKNGKLVDELLGAMPKNEYKSRIDKALGS